MYRFDTMCAWLQKQVNGYRRGCAEREQPEKRDGIFRGDLELFERDKSCCCDGAEVVDGLASG